MMVGAKRNRRSRLLIQAAIAVVPLTIVPIQLAGAQPITLVCQGRLSWYEPKVIEGTAGPSATVVDLNARRITTPVGTFEMSNVRDDAITFVGTQDELIVFGTLDR